MRFRFIYLIAAIACIPIGLVTRRFNGLPEFIQANAGDMIWALMVYFGFGFLLGVKRNVWIIGGCAFAFSVLIECSQLIESKSFDAIRDNTLGRLIFGYGFVWIDLVRYLTGVLVGMLFDWGLLRRGFCEKGPKSRV